MALILGRDMTKLDRKDWPAIFSIESEALDVWLSKDYLAILYQQRIDGKKRLTVNKTHKNGKRYRDGITWDELFRIKNECLGPDVWCIENYPSQDKLIDLENQRHLFIMDEPPAERFPEERYFNF